MLKFLSGLFSSSKTTDTVLDVVNKIAGTGGMTAQEQADFMIKYQEATKHQSPARRLLAVGIFFLYLVTALHYQVLTYIDEKHAELILDFLKASLANPLNIVLIFYFTIQMANGFKGK